MNLLPNPRVASVSILCGLLAACAGTGETGPPTVSRAPAPLDYEKTITNYLAFKIRGPQKNAEIRFGHPEPGDCPLEGYANSSRGWVVPVAYARRAGEATGKETIYITTKQYYFWFLGNTIAGITPRIETCPGIGASFDASGLLATPLPLPAPAPQPPRRSAVDTLVPLNADRAPVGLDATRTPKRDGTRTTKKAGRSSAAARKAARKAAVGGSDAPPATTK
jgi:hypothetical protein